MNKIVSYTTILALAASTPVLFADITAGAPVGAAQLPARANCDLLASNTVSATFLGLHDMTVQSSYDAAPTTVKVAVFEVLQPLGYRRYNSIGDGTLTAGTKFTVAMNRELPGQPASIVDTIEQMQPGEEAVLRIDHLYLLNGRQGEPIRACSRMARKAAQPAPVATDAVAQQPAQADQQQPNQQPAPLPDSVAPLAPQQPAGNMAASFSAQSSSVSITRDADGNVKEVRTTSRFNPATGQMETHKFINGTEVNPQTDEPLQQKVTPAAPAPQFKAAAADAEPASKAHVVGQPKPEKPKAEQPSADSDTVVPDPGTEPKPVPQPALAAQQPAQPAPTPAQSAPAPAPQPEQQAPAAEEEGF